MFSKLLRFQVLILSLLLTQAGCDYSESASKPNDPNSPTDTSGSGDSSSSATRVNIPTYGIAINSPRLAPGQYATSSGGYFSLKQIGITTLTSAQTLNGVASDGSSVYFRINEFQGNSIYRWKIYRIISESAGVELVCDILATDSYSFGLSVDLNYFYMASTYYSSNQQVVRLKKSTCALDTPIIVGRTVMDYNTGYASYGVYSDGFYFTAGGDPVTRYRQDLQTNLLSGVNLSSTSIGTERVTWPTAQTMNTSGIWTISRGTIWKSNLSGNLAAYADIPENDYSDLYNVKTISILDDQTLVISTLIGSVWKRFYVDASRF